MKNTTKSEWCIGTVLKVFAPKVNKMKRLLTLVFLVVFFASCAASENKVAASNNDTTSPTGIKMKIKIGDNSFTAMLYDNETAKVFRSLLPLTVNMIELNGNEKYADLPRSLPTSAFNPGTIQSGDLMLYGPSTLVLFYKTFSTSYNYTKIGRVENSSDLAKTLGAGNVSVSFSLE